jgi:hypothetical protein
VANGFNTAFTNGPLTALGGNNGVFRYGTGGGFPNSSWNNSNYWVDVVFESNGAQTFNLTSITDVYGCIRTGSLGSILIIPVDCEAPPVTSRSAGNQQNQSAVAEPVKEHLRYSLAQNRPNPASGSCVIEYSIPEDNQVVLRLFDMNGNLIQVLENKFRSAGKYQVHLNTSRFRSGAYYYRMESGTFRDTKKLIVY